MPVGQRAVGLLRSGSPVVAPPPGWTADAVKAVWQQNLYLLLRPTW